MFTTRKVSRNILSFRLCSAVTLIVDGAKLSEQVFEKAVKKFLEEIQKSQKPKIYRGRQSLKQLASQNAGLANIEISDKNINCLLYTLKVLSLYELCGNLPVRRMHDFRCLEQHTQRIKENENNL